MPSNREAYFEALKLNIPKAVINFVLQEINGFSYLELTQKFDEEIKDYNSFKKVIERYGNGEMIEYIFNKAYFLSVPFYVDNNVLIPRQETEQLVKEAIELIAEKYPSGGAHVADVCTGSGAIGLSVAKSLKDNKYYLSDISKEAIRVARINSEKLNIENIIFFEGDMLKPFIAQNIKLNVLLCNPPYIESKDTIDERTWKQEPHLALLASPSTLFYEVVFKEYQKVMSNNFLMAFEIGEDMEDALTFLIKQYMPSSKYIFKKDMYGKTRFLFIEQNDI